MNGQLHEEYASNPETGEFCEGGGSGEGPMGPSSSFLGSPSYHDHEDIHGEPSIARGLLIALWAWRGRGTVFLTLGGCFLKLCILGLLSYFPETPASHLRNPGNQLCRVGRL